MEVSRKSYQLLKTKSYLKHENFYFLCNSVAKKASEWLKIERDLKHLNHHCYKIPIKLMRGLTKNSIYKTIKQLLNGNSFLITPSLGSKKTTKIVLKKKFSNYYLLLLSIKVNNKLYASDKLRDLKCLNYTENKMYFRQFNNRNVKTTKTKFEIM